jgi:two-component system, OmpR family, sensor histidine kinase MprB
MSFRRRMVLLAAGAVAAAIVIASVVVYIVTRNELRGQIDASLRQKLTPGLPQAVQIKVLNKSPSELAKLQREGRLPRLPPAHFGFAATAGGGGGSSRNEAISIERKTLLVQGRSAPRGQSRGDANLVLPAPKLGGATGYVQLIQPNGQVLRSESRSSPLPITAATRAVAAGRRDAFFNDAIVAGTPVRVLTERAGEGGVWQVALPLNDLDSTLAHLKLVLALVCLGGIALAAALGLLVSRAALVPVRRLTGAAESVARTQDLGHRIEDAGERDELGRLAESFNTMLATLERSRLAQRQLVSDASHELRTPLTSIQANLDALALGERLPADERTRVVAAAQAQLRELTVLVGDLVDLSKTEVEEVEVEDVRLDLAAAGAIERARLHAPECRFELDAEPCLVRAAPARLDRAIANLLDNACKWNPPSPPAGRVDDPGRGGDPSSEGTIPGQVDDAVRKDDPVEVRVRDGRLQVRDHGPGIATEDLPRVFDRFYRSPSARGLPGSGLGLAIVRQVAEMHGGSVHAANDPGGGARLTLELPPLQMTAAELAGTSAPDVSAPDASAPDAAPVHEAPRLL